MAFQNKTKFLFFARKIYCKLTLESGKVYSDFKTVSFKQLLYTIYWALQALIYKMNHGFEVEKLGMNYFITKP